MRLMLLVWLSVLFWACLESDPSSPVAPSPGAAGSGGQRSPSLAAQGGAGGAPRVDSPGAGGSLPAMTKPSGGGAGGAESTNVYACTVFLGPNVVSEWFEAGFETFVNGDSWQVKAPHRSFVENWADPNSAVWRENDCDGTFFNCETKSPCRDGHPPDRVIFTTQVGNYLGTSQSAWEAAIESALSTIRAKYPETKHIELMTFVRAPDGKDCGNETVISPNLDQAHEALAARSSGTISVAPHFAVRDCADYEGSPHLDGAANGYIAEQIGKHYAHEKP